MDINDWQRERVEAVFAMGRSESRYNQYQAIVHRLNGGYRSWLAVKPNNLLARAEQAGQDEMAGIKRRPTLASKGKGALVGRVQNHSPPVRSSA